MSKNTFEAFDPLKAKSLADTEVAVRAQKREITNILSSYVGWYDPFCELIQNSLDSIEERASSEGVDSKYEPTIWITVNIQENSLIVTDNGIGLDEAKFKQFLGPDISFKSGTSGKTRGHKGVGATYLAYGFNYIQVATRCNGYEAIGRMKDARKWLTDPNPPGNPKMEPDNDDVKDEVFYDIDQGVSIYVKFDKTTNPKDLTWIISDKAEHWIKILSVKTGLGAITPNDNIKVFLRVIDKNGEETKCDKKGIRYLEIEKEGLKAASFVDVMRKQNELYSKKGKNFDLPPKFKNLDMIYQYWDHTQILALDREHITLTREEKDLLEKYQPTIYITYTYSVKIWDAINEKLNVRKGQKILHGGIQIATNNMPQGELIQIPLVRNIGRQLQIHCVIHFKNTNPDLGRKGFQSEVQEFAKEIAKKLFNGPLGKLQHTLRTNTGASPNLRREQDVQDWKDEMQEHERANPLKLDNPNFFLPTKSISITSVPTREQDVIALFNQLIAGGVIRGIKIMSTNERFTYDGLYYVCIDEPRENHLYNEEKNPLGIEVSVLDDFKLLPFKSSSKILEYKYSLDGLIEDIENGTKNSNDIELVVVWETGEAYKRNYVISSYLNPDNLTQREYHGVTHSITNIVSKQKEMDLIVLSELIDFLNDQTKTIKSQIEKYEE